MSLNRGEYLKSENKLSKFQNVFHKKKVLLPVLHVISVPHALFNVEILHRHGVDGIFLIDNYCSAETLLDAFRCVRMTYPDMWLCINILRLETEEVLRAIADLNCNGLWLDNAMIDEDSMVQSVPEFILVELISNTKNLLMIWNVLCNWPESIWT